MERDLRLQKFNDQIADISYKLGSFSIDLTENGFIVNLILIREIDNVTVAYKPSYCFESLDTLDNIIKMLIGKVKLQSL